MSTALIAINRVHRCVKILTTIANYHLADGSDLNISWVVVKLTI
jgi:hypothetical protein